MDLGDCFTLGRLLRSSSCDLHHTICAKYESMLLYNMSGYLGDCFAPCRLLCSVAFTMCHFTCRLLWSLLLSLHLDDHVDPCSYVAYLLPLNRISPAADFIGLQRKNVFI